jgi:hypothetical protein
LPSRIPVSAVKGVCLFSFGEQIEFYAECYTACCIKLTLAYSILNYHQELKAQGKLPPGKGGLFRKADDEQQGVFRHVVINDAPPELRHHLTKRPTQDDIARRTGTQIVTRGRYMAPGTPQTDTDKPLYLNITPGMCANEVSSTSSIVLVEFFFIAIVTEPLVFFGSLDRHACKVNSCPRR